MSGLGMLKGMLLSGGRGSEPISNLHLVHRIDNTTSPDLWHTLSLPDLLPTAPS
jgi:hypothetical protein